MGGQTTKRSSVVFFTVFLIAAGCTMANYGKLEPNPEVTREFNAHQVLPGHKYYYRGTFNQPIAIVGISKDYRLQSELWLEIDQQSRDFRALIERVSLQGGGAVIEPWGFVILDASGNRVGVWYSAIRAATVQVDANGTITRLWPQPLATRGNPPR